jgi:hypothetical protein
MLIVRFLISGIMVLASSCPVALGDIGHSNTYELKPTVIEAKSLQSSGTVISATGNVLVQVGSFKIRASEVWFDTRTQQGKLTEATFTTCNKEYPDYHLQARELTFLPNKRIRARGVSAYIGKFRLVGLPSITFAAGRNALSTDAFPRPIYDEQEGFGVAQRFPLVDQDRWQLVTDIRFTTKRGLLGEGESLWGIDGDLNPLTNRFVEPQLTKLGNPIALPIRNEHTSPPELPSSGARWRQFVRVAMDQRAYSVAERELSVSKQPEIGLLYAGRPLRFRNAQIDPAIELCPSVNVSWGRYKENTDRTVLTKRVGFDASTGINLLPVRHNLAVQPILGYSAYRYEGGSTYRTWLRGVDASRIFRNGSLVTLRYLKRSEHGKSPFLFDTAQVTSDLQGMLQVRLGSQVIGFAAGYDTTTNRLYDWEVLLSYHTDCLAVWLAWNNLQRRLALGTALTNF